MHPGVSSSHGLDRSSGGAGQEFRSPTSLTHGTRNGSQPRALHSEVDSSKKEQAADLASTVKALKAQVKLLKEENKALSQENLAKSGTI